MEAYFAEVKLDGAMCPALVERKIGKPFRWVKFNVNDGSILSQDKGGLANAFSHWTY